MAHAHTTEEHVMSAVISCSNRRDIASSVFCGSALRQFDLPSYSPQPCRPASSCFSAYWLAVAKCYLQQSISHARIDADIVVLLSFIHRSLLVGDLNTKHPFRKSIVSNPWGMKWLDLLHLNEFEISAPQCPTYYSFAGNGDMLNIFVHKNVQL
jgi:hypothetical protein